MPSKANNNKVETTAKKGENSKRVVSEDSQPKAAKVPAKQGSSEEKKAPAESEVQKTSKDVKKPGPVAAKGKQARKESEKESTEETEESTEESDSEEETTESSSSESDSEESEDSDDKGKKKAPVKMVVKKPEGKKVDKQSDSEESDEEAVGPNAKKATQKTGKQAKKENLDDILEELGVEGEQKLSKAQLKRLKKKDTPASAPTATSTSVPSSTPAASTATPAASAQAVSTTTTVADVTDKLAELSTAAKVDGDQETDEKKMSKAQLARLKKKEKELQKKDVPVAAKAPDKKPSALAERIKREREERERAEKAEADRIAAEEAAEKARLEEEKRIEQEKLDKKAAKAAKRAADKAAGLILSKTEKKKEKANRHALEMWKASGQVGGPPGGPVLEGEAEIVVKKKRPDYGKKKKKPDDKGKPRDNEQGSPREGEQADDAGPPVTKRADSEEADRLKKEAEAEKLDAIEEKEPDWDLMMASSDQGEDAGVKESWDVDSDEEREKEIERKTAHDKRKAAKAEQVTKLRREFEERRAARLARIEARAREKERQQQEKKAAAAATATASGSAVGTGASDDQNKKRDYRSPICCILGHVDTGKTKLLDKIRHTNVQDMEAGGITQQIGATYFPTETIRQQTQELQEFYKKELDIKIPGLLVIDTPGHESFSNLRSRGSGLCDIAILVVDIMAGLEKQTLESINLLKMRKTPFVVALNKCDRMFGWKAIPNCPFRKTLATQTQDAQQEFDRRLRQIIVLFAEQGLNTEVYWENSDFKRNISIIPTSAITGEGVPDLLTLLVQLTQKMMTERLMYLSELQCTVLEVKVIEGHGTTVDVVLVNGVLHEGDTIVLCGMQGPIVTKIRALLTPPPMRELRVKADYTHLKMVKAAAGLKISAPNLEHAVPGSQLLVCGPRDDIEELKDEVMQDLATILARVDRSGVGVCVQASTLGSLEALLAFLKECKIPVSAIAIGPVHKKDVMRAATMLERRREYAIILAFDVTVSAEAHQWATEMGVRIFTADIIYHLFEMCTNYMAEIRNKSIEAAATVIVFPCILEVVKDCVFRNRDPLLLGVRILEGLVKIGTPLCVVEKQNLMIGRITSVQRNYVEVHDAKAGDEVCIKIEAGPGEQKMQFGRHFDYENRLVSRVTRQSIDQLKLHFKDDLSQENWLLVLKLKKMFDIM